MSRRAIEVEVIFFDILTVVAFAVRQPEQTLFKNWVVAIPQAYAKAEQLLVITDTGEAVLAPVIRAGASLVMGKVIPGISVLAVVLANRTPLPFAEVGSPSSPVRSTRAGFLQADFFLCHVKPHFHAGLAAALSPVFLSGAGSLSNASTSASVEVEAAARKMA